MDNVANFFGLRKLKVSNIFFSSLKVFHTTPNPFLYFFSVVYTTVAFHSKSSRLVFNIPPQPPISCVERDLNIFLMNAGVLDELKKVEDGKEGRRVVELR